MRLKINNTLSEIKKMSRHIPKSINEAIDYGGDEEMEFDDMPMRHEAPKEMPEDDGHMDISRFIDDIRKKALKGMAQLADNPDNPNYECLKRIWQVCDKAYSDQKNGMAGQQPQQMQRPQR